MPSRFGSSDNLKVGSTSWRFGSPFGLDNSVSTGIISGLGRSNMIQNQTQISTYVNLIQTDAAVNPETLAAVRSTSAVSLLVSTRSSVQQAVLLRAWALLYPLIRPSTLPTSSLRRAAQAILSRCEHADD